MTRADTLTELRHGWDQAAREDAMFNILTDPNKRHGGWDPDDFFAHGVEEIDAVVARLDDLGLRGDRRHWALDFGCGVGRLTQALANHYEFVDGVDVSEEMVALAEKHRRHNRRVRYFHMSNLKVFDRDSFDFIYSAITLQHMPQRLQRGYVKEFVRLLVKDGLACFQIPEHNGADLIHPKPWLSMHGTSRDTVESWITDAGGQLLDVESSEHGGAGWTGYRYTVARA